MIRTTYDISRTETLIYLRVFSAGLAEGHSTAKVDRRELALKQLQVPPNDLAKLAYTPTVSCAAEKAAISGRD